MGENTIPVMTHSWGTTWKQPNRKDILVDEESALMSLADFYKLQIYGMSVPGGVYEGKMWKRRFIIHWRLLWYGPSDTPGECSIEWRNIVIVK